MQEQKKKPGILYGVGVGTGDPEDLTLKALHAMQHCPVLMVPVTPKEDSMAYRIALATCPEIVEKEVLDVEFPMTRDIAVRKRAVQKAYRKALVYLEQGMDVAFLTIGDVTIYSTFFYLKPFAEKDGIEMRLINGVPSFIGAAVAHKMSLCLEQEELHIIPGNGNVEASLRLPGTKVYMKAGRNLEKLRDILLKYPDLQVYSVKDCGLPTEEVSTGIEEIPMAYMVIVIVKGFVRVK